VLAMELQSGNAEDSTSGTDLFRRSTARKNAVRRIRQIAADKAYSKSRSFFEKAHKAGVYVVFDLNENQLGRQAVVEGHPVVDGAAYCPCLPDSLSSLGPAPSTFNKIEPAPYQMALEAREPYRLPLHGRTNPDGSHRVTCPVLTGQARCSRRPSESATVDQAKPLILPTAKTPKAAVCEQQTKSMPGEKDGLQLQPQYPYGTAEWRGAYGKYRNQAEGSFGNLKTGPTQMRRGAIHVTGLTKTGLMLALSLAVKNLRACGAVTAMTHRASRGGQALRVSEADFTPEGWARYVREITTARDGRSPPDSRNRNG
jgi:hypothetical protein